MKPTLDDIARARRDAERIIEDASSLGWQQATELARILLAVTSDPTPLPAPALGMRVWYSYGGAGYDGKPLRCSGSADISEIGEGDAWDDWVVPDRIDLITDFRTGEVLWRRQ